MNASAKTVPSTDVAGLREHWRHDLIAGFSVALVALPLALGIATAAGVPPISGLVSAVVAGLITTFARGSHVAINGPGNSLVVIVASGLVAFGGGVDSFPHVLGAVVVAGALQMALGVLRLGKLGDLIPAAVVQGLLAAIGLIIVGKQAHVMFGHATPRGTPIEALEAIWGSVLELHPGAALIGLTSLLILIVHPRIKAEAVHYIPAPLWVVIITVPMALCMTAFDDHIIARAGPGWTLDSALLVSIPDDLLGALVHPDFSTIGEPRFWMVVVTLTLVTSLENVVSVKAVDKLDPYRRRSNLDRDLVAVGASTVLSGFLGGLPVLTVIARSSVNVNHGGRTGWSNFFHGAILLVLVVFLAPVIEEIALAALASILVYTGYKLTAPHVVRDTIRKGPDHFVVFGITVLATLIWGLLWGIVVGLAAELFSHFLIIGLPAREALRLVRETTIETVHEKENLYLLRVGGAANFLAIPRMRRALDVVPEGNQLIVDFSSAALVDNTLLEYCHDRGRWYQRRDEAGEFSLIGLEAHTAISDHPDALHAQQRHAHVRRMTARQKAIMALAEARGWSFDPRRDWDPNHLDDFQFFRIHPIEYRDTVVHGRYDAGAEQVEFTLADVTFDEGALIPEVYHTTAQLIRPPEEMPELILHEEGLLARALDLARIGDIDFPEFEGFTRKYVLRGPDEHAVRRFMTPSLLRFLEREGVYHLESNGVELVVFKTLMRRATASEVEEMLGFTERLVALLAG